MTEYDTIDGKPIAKRIYHTQRCCYVDVVAVDVGRPQRGKPDPNRTIRATGADRALFGCQPQRSAPKTADILDKIDEYLRGQPNGEAWIGDVADLLGITKKGASYHIRANPDRYTEQNRASGAKVRMFVSLVEGAKIYDTTS